MLATTALGSNPSRAAEAPVALGTAGSYAVLGGSTVTNTGASVINGNLGLSPGTSVTGFPPGAVNGVQHIADAAALQAQSDPGRLQSLMIL
ncbi:ice-binding family protein [Actinacidiphila soli]|uniref:ice-binding family protein n=1 Tax=Actinacidiphila soli TaxID=2487275 RepID=UPI000FCB9DDD|nr:ice-binding family protein [Actinacidiphila soli]